MSGSLNMLRKRTRVGRSLPAQYFRSLARLAITGSLVTGLLLSSVVYAASIDIAAIDALVDGEVDDGAPGLAVGVVLDGEIAYEAYAGLADLEHAVAVGPSTQFNLASNAKQFTALAILDLASKGILSLDDDLRKHFPGLFEEVASPIRIRHLITHSSGIRDVYDLWAISGTTWWQAFIGNDDALALLARQTDLNFEPGTEYLYSNSNYILLAEIIRKVTDSPFGVLTDKLYERLGMPNTGFVTSYMGIIPNRARGYGNFGSWVAFPAITEFYGDGWLYSTLEDQLTWEILLQSTGSGPLDELLDNSQKPVPGVEIRSYGFGLEFGEYKGLDTRFHDGSTGALKASFIRFPGERLSIVVLSNNAQVAPRELATAIADQVLGSRLRGTQYPERPDELSERPANRDVLGLYDTAETGTLIRIVERDGALFREIDGRDPVRLVHEVGNVFQYESNPNLRMAFNLEGDGQPQLTIYLASQAPLEAVRLVEAETGNLRVSDFEGRFVNAETDATFSLSRVDDRLVLSVFGQRRDVRFNMADVFDAFGYRFKARRDRAGNVTGFLITGGRLRHVWFARQ